MVATNSTGAASDAVSAPALYRAVWRWHFYAGLLCVPFMILLAVTGGLYLFKDEFNGLLYANYLTVVPQATAPLSAEVLVERALAAVPGTATTYLPPAAADDSAVVGVASDSLGARRVYLDPYSGAVLGSIEDGGAARSPLMLLIRKIHSLDYFGWVANRVIEIVAGWAIVLVATGTYLWWPRDRTVGVFAILKGATRRGWWRDLHAVTGLYVGGLIFFLAITGLPWSGYWGAKVNSYADQAGLGYPPEFWNEVPASAVPHHGDAASGGATVGGVTMGEAMTQTAWSLENAPMPESTLPAGDGAAAPIGLDRALAIFDRLGVHRGYAVDLPGGPEGVYSASVFPDDVAFERVVHLDQYSGAVLFDGGFADLGGVGKAIEWGISVHMGQEFGLFNQLFMATTCLAIVVMAVSGVVMWWKRKPVGRLGAPPAPARRGAMRNVVLIVLPLAVLFPLVGASLIAVLLLDLLVVQRLPGLKAALS